VVRALVTGAEGPGFKTQPIQPKLSLFTHQEMEGEGGEERSGTSPQLHH